MQSIDGGNRIAIEFHEQISLTQPRSGRGTIRLDCDYEHSTPGLQSMIPHETAMKRGILTADTKVTPPDFSVFDQPRSDMLRSIDADGKTDPLRWQNHCRVHADDLSARIHERAAGIARVQGRIGLDDIVH